MKKIVIIGAGMGGLAAAMELSAAGHAVTVFERALEPGGKMRTVTVPDANADARADRGFGDQRQPQPTLPIDAGPTVLTLRWVFEELFAQSNANLDEHLTLRPAPLLARHAWAGDQVLDLYADKDRSADAIGAFAGAAEARGYLAFCRESKRMYDTLERSFLQSERPSKLGLVARVGVIRALQLKPYEIYMTELTRHFKDKRLQQLFGRYATYCGTSPYQAAATLMLVAHVEQAGVWLVEGGMHRLASAMAGVAERNGARFRYNEHVAEVMVAAGRVTGVRLPDGAVIHADAVLMNGEPQAIAGGLLGNAARAAGLDSPKFPQRSLSATTWAMRATVTGLPLVRHNVFFSSDYPLEFKTINAGMMPTEPTTYICAQDRDAEPPVPGAAPQTDAERLLILVNAPASGDRRAFTQVEIEQCMQGVSALLDRCGLRIQATAPPVLTTPAQFHRLFPASAGALYGQATLPGGSTFKRPGARTKLPGLYLAGGSVHPGAGVPMAALSGRLAAAAMLEDFT